MRFLLIALGFLLAGCGASNYPPAQPTLSLHDAIYQLNSGDVVTLRIFDEPELSGRYKIDSQGMIALPLAGKISVKGKNEQQAALGIAKALEKGGYLRNPKVTLDVRDTRPFFVLGEVEHAGQFPFQPGMTIYQAVAIAGGYTYRADRDDVVVRRQTGRGAGTEIRLSATEDTPVLPGDAIEIGERFF